MRPSPRPQRWASRTRMCLASAVRSERQKLVPAEGLDPLLPDVSSCNLGSDRVRYWRESLSVESPVNVGSVREWHSRAYDGSASSPGGFSRTGRLRRTHVKARGPVTEKNSSDRERGELVWVT